MALIPFLFLSLLNFLPYQTITRSDQITIYVRGYILRPNSLVMALMPFLLLCLLNFLLYRTITRLSNKKAILE